MHWKSSPRTTTGPLVQLGPKEVSQFQLHLVRDRKLSAQTVKQHVAALRFFFVRTLKRHFPPGEFLYPKIPRRLPIILSLDEVRRMIDAATTLLHRSLLMTLYSTGMRRAEVTRLKVNDVDSERMIIHIRQEKGSKDRDVPLSPKLLETLPEYWRWKKCRSTSDRGGLTFTVHAPRRESQ
jgi:integrase/recombinase XerD